MMYFCKKCDADQSVYSSGERLKYIGDGKFECKMCGNIVDNKKNCYRALITINMSGSIGLLDVIDVDNDFKKEIEENICEYYCFNQNKKITDMASDDIRNYIFNYESTDSFVDKKISPGVYEIYFYYDWVRCGFEYEEADMEFEIYEFKRIELDKFFPRKNK